MIGGFLGVTMRTGAIEGGISRIVGRLKGRESLMIPILMIVFAIGGSTFGMAEESLAFYALIITVMIAAGYDSLVAASILLLGCGIGVLGSTINPFATGIASGFAGVSIEEGIVGRLIILVVGTAIGIVFVMRYAARVKADPDRVARGRPAGRERGAFRTTRRGDTAAATSLSGRQQGGLVLFTLAFIVMIYGVIPWEDLGVGLPTLWWWFPEMTASFLLFAILIGTRQRGCRRSDFTSTFVDGARDLLGVALIIGIARGITVIMNNGLITDTVLNAAEQADRRPRRRGLHQPHVLPVPAALVPHPVIVRPGDRGDADHGPAGEFRRRAGTTGRDRLSERERAGQPRDPDLGGGHGWAGDRPGGLWDMAPFRLAGPDPVGDPDCRRPDRCDAAAVIGRTKRDVGDDRALRPECPIGRR